jgi:hypothetical protein
MFVVFLIINIWIIIFFFAKGLKVASVKVTNYKKKKDLAGLNNQGKHICYNIYTVSSSLHSRDNQKESCHDAQK